MAEKVFSIWNGSAATVNVASPGALPTSQPTFTSSAAVRTMLQIEVGSVNKINLVEWGISFDGSAAATPVKVDLIGTSVAATMSTASVAADVTNLNDPTGEASSITFGGTTHTGFATAAVTEGTLANYRLFDLQLVAPTAQYVKQFPLGREPVVATSKFLRVRIVAPAAVNCYCYVIWSE